MKGDIMTFIDTLECWLNSLGADEHVLPREEHVELGKKSKARQIKLEDKLLLIERLERVRISNNRLAAIAIIVHILLLGVAIYFSWYYRDNSNIVLSIIGSSASILLYVGKQLANIWRDKISTDILLCILPSLPSSEAIKIVESIYERFKSKNEVSKND